MQTVNIFWYAIESKVGYAWTELLEEVQPLSSKIRKFAF